MRTQFYLLALFLIVILPSHANVDSLIYLLNNTESTSKKTELCEEIAQGLLTKNPTLAIDFCDRGINKSNGKKNGLVLANLYKTKGTAYFYLNEMDSVKRYWTKSVQSIPNNSKAEMADGYNNLGVYFQKVGNSDSSIYYHRLALKLRLQQKEEIPIAKSYNNIAVLKRKEGELARAIELYAQALVIYQKNGLKKEVADVLMGVGLIHKELNHFETARNYFQEALEIYTSIRSTRGRGNAINNLGVVYLDMGQDSLAENHFLMFRELAMSIGDASGNAGTQINLAIIYKKRGDFEKSLTCYKQGLGYYTIRNDRENMAIIQNNMGLLYEEVGKFDLGIVSFREAIRNAEATKRLEIQKIAHKGLSNLLKKKGQFEEALEHLTLYTLLQDSLSLIELNDKVAKYQELYEAEKREKEIRELKYKVTAQETRAKVNRMYRNGLIVLAIFLIGFLILLVSRFKLKRKVLLQNARLIEEEKEAYRLKSALVEQEVEAKNRELSSLATHAMNKNESLQTLSDKLKNFKAESKEEVQEAIHDFERQIKRSFNLDKDWEDFQRHFSSVHPNFFSKLQIQFPKLSSNDLRICAYIRMNLSTKEISSLMNIAPKSARMNRYRLKKKLGLFESDDLHEYIANQ